MQAMEHERFRGAVGVTGGPPRVALAHDYLTTQGGAERVVVSIMRAFPDAALYTSVYEPESIYPELADPHLDVRPSVLNRSRMLRQHYRMALPVLAVTFSRLHIDADVVVCSSSGWSHGVATEGRKVVYCHNPARWLYQRTDYLAEGRKSWWLAANSMGPALRAWDKRAAASCHRYLANSSIVARRIQRVYGRDAEVLPPPATLDAEGPQLVVEGLEPGFVLCVGRLMAYKGVREIVEAARLLPDLRVVLVGDGPLEGDLRLSLPRNVVLLGRVPDTELRWLYANCSVLVAASREDFGLTPVEAALFGRPSVVLRYGGFLDTMVEGVTATFFDEPEPRFIAAAIKEALATNWDAKLIVKNAERYSEQGFIRRLREIVAEEAQLARV